MQNVKQDFGIRLLPQECKGNYRFIGRVVMTAGFVHEFGEVVAPYFASTAVQKIRDERVNSKGGADYLQVLEHGGVKFWIIDDVEYVTMLMPSDY